MSTGYQINDQEGLYYLTFQSVDWIVTENNLNGSRRLQNRSGEVKKTSPSGGGSGFQYTLAVFFLLNTNPVLLGM